MSSSFSNSKKISRSSRNLSTPDKDLSRTLPSINPIPTANPDTLSNIEKIQPASNPNKILKKRVNENESPTRFIPSPEKQKKYSSPMKEKEAREIAKKFATDRIALEKKLGVLATEFQSLLGKERDKDDKIAMLATEIQRLKQVTLPVFDVTPYEEKISLLMNEVQKKNGLISYYDNKVNEMNEELKNLKTFILNKDKDETLEQKLAVLATELQRKNIIEGENEEKINILEKEIVRLRQLNIEPTEKLTLLASEFERQRSKMDIANQTIEEQNRIINQYKIREQGVNIHVEELSREQIELYENKIALISSELQRKNTVLEQKTNNFKKEIAQLAETNSFLVMELERLKENNEFLVQSNRKSRVSVQNLEYSQSLSQSQKSLYPIQNTIYLDANPEEKMKRAGHQDNTQQNNLMGSYLLLCVTVDWLEKEMITIKTQSLEAEKELKSSLHFLRIENKDLSIKLENLNESLLLKKREYDEKMSSFEKEKSKLLQVIQALESEKSGFQAKMMKASQPEGDQLIMKRKNQELIEEIAEWKARFNNLAETFHNKIDHLPDLEYKFVLICAEIERLWKLNDGLSSSNEVKDLIEDQRKYSELKEKKLNEKIMDLNRELADKEFNISDLSRKITYLEKEIENWKERYSNLEIIKNREIEDALHHNETLRQSQMDRELRDLTLKYENEKRLLESEILKTKGKEHFLNAELESLKNRVNELENSVSEHKEKLIKKESIVVSHEERIEKIKRSYQEENDFLQNRSRQLDQYKDQIRLLTEQNEESRVKLQKVEFDKQVLVSKDQTTQDQLRLLNDQLDDYKNRARKAESEKQNMSNMEISNKLLREQIERDRDEYNEICVVLNDKKKYIESLKQKKKSLKIKCSQYKDPEPYLIRLMLTSIEIERLNEELNRLSFTLNEKDNELKNYSQTLIQESVSRKSAEEKVKRSIADEAMRKNQILVEVNTLNSKVSELNNVNERLKREIIDLTDQYKAEITELKENKEREIRELSKKYMGHKEILEFQLSNFTTEKQKLEREKSNIEGELVVLREKYTNIEKEYTKSLGIIKSRDLEFENWREKVQKLEEQRIRELEELRSHLDIIKQSHFSAGQAEIEAERMAYETSISQLKGRVNDLESALSSTTFDLEEVRKIYNYQMKELELARKKTKEGSSYDQIQNENSDLKRQAFDAKELILKLENERKAYESQINHYKQRMNIKEEELSKCYGLLEERKRERDASIKKVAELKQELENEKVQRENGFLLINQLEEITKARDRYKSQAERNSIELTNKNKEMINKLEELDRLKGQYQYSFNNLKKLELQLIEKMKEEDIYIA